MINEYARSAFNASQNRPVGKRSGAPCRQEFHLDENSAVFLPMLDKRFVKKEKLWTLQRYVDQKTKLRASRIDRLYKFLLKHNQPISAHQLTATVLHMPSNMTDVEEKLAADPRFACEDGLWDLRSRGNNALSTFCQRLSLRRSPRLRQKLSQKSNSRLRRKRRLLTRLKPRQLNAGRRAGFSAGSAAGRDARGGGTGRSHGCGRAPGRPGAG